MHQIKPTTALLLFSLSIVLFLPAALAQRGSLDPSFGNSGKVVTALGDFGDRGFAVALQNDNILLAGMTQDAFTTGDFALVRYLSDGTLDPSFGTNGAVITPIEHQSQAHDIALQDDGKIVLAGASRWFINLARYHENGALDTTFGMGGTLVTDLEGYYSEKANALLLQDDGKMIIAGTAQHFSNDQSHVILVRYNADGTLDTSFGENDNGIVIGPLGSSLRAAWQSDGKIVLGGTSNNAMALYRFLGDGTLDTSFGTGGEVSIAAGAYSEGLSLIIQPNDKIVLGGSSGFSMAVARALPDGDLDPSFGNNGIVIEHTGSGYALALQENGNILLGGEINQQFAAARYLADGSLDTSFGTGGTVSTAIGNSGIGFAFAIQSDGNIVQGGYSHNGENLDMAVVRYHGEAPTGLTGHDANSKAVVFPNPIHTTATIQLNTPLQHGSMKLIDVFGREVSQWSDLSGADILLHRNDWDAGTYFLQVMDKDALLLTKKVVVTD